MNAVINYTLPAIQLMCHLVAPGNTGIDYINPVPAAVTQSPPQLQPTTLPAGYVAHPEIGLAYKAYPSHVSVIEASNTCIKEGAQLAIFDSAEKVKAFTDQLNWAVYAGIVRFGDNDKWISVRTGLPMSSVPWASGYPIASGNCVSVARTGGVRNQACTDNLYYVCERPIPAI